MERSSTTSTASGDTRSRAETLRDLQAGPLDMLIVGGGIVGSGVARDAAMRGLRVGLVEQHDFAFGTSSRSSRLLHGGLRYLAQGRVGLVREASLEKRVLSTIAPHLALPLPFIFPTYRGTEWVLWKLRIGVKIYDLLCSGKNLGKSSSMNADGTHRELPMLDTEKLTGAVRYFDGLTNDARLVLDTLRSARKAEAHLLNYVRVFDPVRDGDVWRVSAQDRTTDETVTLTARTIVNAAGPWAQGFGPSAVQLRRTKGVHLVVDRSKLPVNDAVVLTEGSRILFVIPWGERLILGTTDTDYDDTNEAVRTEREDIDYILGIVNKSFPSVDLTVDDVLSHWAGLRPLIADPGGKPSDISRNHQIRSPKPGWWDVAGGKLTTYRLMAEQTVDRVVEELKLHMPHTRTATEPLLPADQVKFSGIVPQHVSREAVEHFCNDEWAVHLDDVMVRRSSWAYYDHAHDEEAERVSHWMAELLGWDEERRASELDAFRALPLWPAAVKALTRDNASSSPVGASR